MLTNSLGEPTNATEIGGDFPKNSFSITPDFYRWSVRSVKVFLALWVLFYVVYGTKLALWFDGYPVNGPFQIFDPLRRIAAGQVIGRDFVFFHGIGIPYLHYPLFALFGGSSLQASELSRQWTSILLFLSSLGAFIWVALRDTRRFWIAAALCIVFMEATFLGIGPSPGHSLISARSTMPIFTFTVLQLRISNWLKALLTGGCIGLAFVLGTEHGISLTMALFVVLGISLLKSILKRDFIESTIGVNLKFAIMAGAAATVSAASIILLLCGFDGARQALRYALVDLPGDQFWFFGGPPMPYLGAWSELVLNPHVIRSFLGTDLALIILGCILVRFRGCPFRLGRDWQALAVLMLVYGILTSAPLLAILSRHYVFPLARILALVTLLVYAHGAVPRLTVRWSLNKWDRGPVLATGLVLTTLSIASLALAYKSTVLMIGLIRHWREPATYSRFTDAHWNSFMSEATRVIDSNRKRNHLSLWSAYSALLEWHYGIFHPAEDYIIHTVGPQRWRHYVNTFRASDPEFVTTMTPSFSFEEWLQDVRWEFYEDLLNNYRPLRDVEHATIWQRKEGSWILPSANFRTQTIDNETSSVTLPAMASEQLGVVRVRYIVSNPWRRIPLIGSTPRYLAIVEGTPRNLPISFPPYLTEFQFPIQLPSKRAVTLRFKTSSLLPAATFQLQEVQMKVLDWQASYPSVFAPAHKPVIAY